MMFDLAIVGAGPAGMTAAETACQQNMRVIIIDDQNQAGGQILRRPPSEFSVREWLPQRVYRHLHALYEKFSGLQNLTHLNSTSVLGISRVDDSFKLSLLGPSGFEQLQTSKVLIATGCFDMPFTFSGAQLPGVMATGGLQAFLKSQQIIPGEKFLFVGSHPLQLIVANQVASAGGKVAGVVFTQTLSSLFGILKQPLVLLRQLPNIVFFIGVVMQLVVKKVPIRFNTSLVSAEGETSLQRVQLKANKSGSKAEFVECDRLGVCFGFLTNNDLLRQAGGQCIWSQESGGWVAKHDEGMRSSVAGIYVAGETAGVAGANVACIEGRLAALTANRDAGRLSSSIYANASAKLRSPLTTAREFATLLAKLSYPSDKVVADAMTDDAQLCKCEEVTVGTVIKALKDNPDVSDLNSLKLLTRCGMGHCQGRYCHYQSRFVLARERSLAPETLGGFTARFPNRPTRIKDLLGTESSDHLQ